MTLAQLIAAYRRDAHDRALPYFVEDADLIDLFNEAEREACVRARLIHEEADPDVCTITVNAGTSVYALHDKLYELTHCAFLPDGDSRRVPLKIRSTEWLDDNVADWRDAEGDPEYLVQRDKTVRMVPSPDRAGELLIEGFRLPMADMATPADDSPEIHEAHHIHLVQWALHRAFSIPDSEFFDANRSAMAEGRFSDYFGLRPDADLRRIVRHDEVHHVEAFMP